ncbi:DUF1294 domain-containing protein [bacterium]|nr:MAG: DUF1294 domain-containing protein [bacterium]
MVCFVSVSVSRKVRSATNRVYFRRGAGLRACESKRRVKPKTKHLPPGTFPRVPAAAPRRYQGEIVEWSDEKRCGFIRPRGTTAPDQVVFLSAKSLSNRTRKPAVGDVVTYETVILENSAKNRHLRTRVRAENASFLGETPHSPRPGKYNPPTPLAAAYLILLLAASIFIREAIWILAASLTLSVLSLVEYAYDKSAAQQGRRRISESGLQFTALLGGWPGAAVAQSLLRHKTQKSEFQRTYLVIVAVNIAATLGVIGLLFVTQR